MHSIRIYLDENCLIIVRAGYGVSLSKSNAKALYISLRLVTSTRRTGHRDMDLTYSTEIVQYFNQTNIWRGSYRRGVTKFA